MLTETEEHNVSVNPETSPKKKPFLGGYRNKLTGQLYHHAKVQTAPSPWKYPQVERFNRQTQTVKTKEKDQQTAYDAFTQVEVPGIYIPKTNDKDRPITGNYEYADTIEKRRLDATVKIQTHVRGWLARRMLNDLKNQYLSHILWDEEQSRQKNQEEIDWLNELEHRKIYPKTKDDFALLFSELQKWWIQQSNELKSTKSGAELKASYYTLLDEEVEKIKEIENKRQKVTKFHSLEKREEILSKASAPKLWKAYKEPIYVETSGTQQARVLRDLYTTLCKPKLKPADRISALTQLKETVKVRACALTSNLIALADREIDLLQRGISENNLSGLRLRIRNLVWQYCRQPALNPETQRFLKLRAVNGKMPAILLCSSCNEYYIMPHDSLEESANCSVLQQRFTKCKKCKYLENEGWIRKDLEIYKRMLKLLKEAEEKKPTMSGIIYLIQPSDLGLLVEKIWRCQSCLSGLSVLKDLEFVRWDILKNWTPWNCLLVTRDEAVLHNHLDNYKTMYDKEFCMSIKLKHIEARNYFSSIPRFLPYLLQQYDKDEYDTTAVNDDNVSAS